MSEELEAFDERAWCAARRCYEASKDHGFDDRTRQALAGAARRYINKAFARREIYVQGAQGGGVAASLDASGQRDYAPRWWGGNRGGKTPVAPEILPGFPRFSSQMTRDPILPVDTTSEGIERRPGGDAEESIGRDGKRTHR